MNLLDISCPLELVSFIEVMSSRSGFAKLYEVTPLTVVGPNVLVTVASVLVLWVAVAPTALLM